MRIIPILVFGFCLCLSNTLVNGEVNSSNSTNKESLELFSEGLDSFLDGNIVKAKFLWNRAVKVNPNNVHAKRGLHTIAMREMKNRDSKTNPHVKDVEVILSSVKYTDYASYLEGIVRNKLSDPIIVYGRTPGEVDSSTKDFYINLTYNNPKIHIQACQIRDGMVVVYEGRMRESEVILKPNYTLSFHATLYPYDGESITFQVGVNSNLGEIWSNPITVKGNDNKVPN